MVARMLEGREMNPVPVSIHAEDERGNVLTLLAPLEFIWRGRIVSVPAGFESDGVSTPRCLWATVSPAIHPQTLRAGIAHDYIYRTQPDDWTRAEADALFYDLARDDGFGWFRAQKAYWGLRLFGGAAWRDNAKRLQNNLKRTGNISK